MLQCVFIRYLIQSFVVVIYTKNREINQKSYNSFYNTIIINNMSKNKHLTFFACSCGSHSKFNTWSGCDYLLLFPA